MIDERLIDKLVERLVDRIEEGNSYTLQKIGESIKKIGALSPSKAQQLGQILKYGGNFDKIVQKLSQITKLNVKEIYEIFEEVAKNDYAFAKQFYDYKGVKYIPYEQNIALQNQVKALARITANEYVNLSNTLAFTKRINGRVIYTDLARTYQDTLDKAILSVAQGKSTFDEQMYSTIKELASSGLKTVDYANGRSVRLDSSVRQHLKGALRNLHNETQAVFGEEFGSDGVEISVHINPAPDHAEVQGRQFSKEEFDKFQNDQDATDYTGKVFTSEHDGHDRRSISEYNCYHYTFDIVLGVSKPNYSEEELRQIIDDNNKGFELDGEHYTNYEGTQLQRKLETEIRKQKDIQIMAKASGNKELVAESQSKITQLTRKYKQLSDISGLPTKMERMRVNGYRRVKVDMPKMNNYKEIEYARKNNTIWHSTESLEKIIKDDKIIAPSISVAKELNTKVKYGTQFIEFKPEILENVNKNTILYNGDGGNQFSNKASKFDNLMQMLKDKPKNYNELKFDNDLESLKYIKKVYIRQDEPKEIIKMLKEKNIEYEIYEDYRIRGFKKKK